MYEIPTAVAAYAITMLILWLFTCEDAVVKEGWKRPLGIVLRMAGLFVVLHLFLISLPFDAWQVYSVIVCAIAFSLIWQLYDFDLFVVGIIGWLIYQWAFWFPVKEEMVLKQKPKGELGAQGERLPKYGVATTDLKPIGKIAVEGEERTALSTLGFVSRGERVVIEGGSGSELRVRKENVS